MRFVWREPKGNGIHVQDLGVHNALGVGTGIETTLSMVAATTTETDTSKGKFRVDEMNGYIVDNKGTGTRLCLDFFLQNIVTGKKVDC